MTATAKRNVVDDIIKRLGMRDCVSLSQSFNRPNLNYEIRPKGRNVLGEIANYIKSHHPNESGVIYCLSRNSCEDLAKNLREKHDIKAKHYHAGMTPQDKAMTQGVWQDSQCDVIVATVRMFCVIVSVTLIFPCRSRLVWALIRRMVCLRCLYWV